MIQEPPKLDNREKKDPRPSHAVTVSGHTASSLKRNLERLIAYTISEPDISPGDLSYTTTARRNHYAFRLTVAEPTIERIRVALQNKQGLAPYNSLLSSHKHSVIFCFTGQGATYAALAQELYVTSTQFRADISLFDGIARQQGYPSFIPLVDGAVPDINQLSATQSQVGLVSVQIALARLWRSWGVNPTAVIGHSLGEYAALQVAGVLSISDAIFLVGHRARLLETHCQPYTHSMLAVSGTSAAIEPLLSVFSEEVEIACSNSPRETVFAGRREVIDKLEAHLSGANIRCTKLQVPFAFHTAQVDPILDHLEDVAKMINFGAPQIPILSSYLGRPLATDDRIDANYIRQHCRHPVQFASALESSQDQGLVNEASVFIEIGPHPICLGMIRGILGDTHLKIPTLKRKENPWKVIVSGLASLHDQGFSINWSEYHRDFDDTHLLLSLPSYAFDNKKYWLEYRNDWTLRKGDTFPTIESSNHAVEKPSKLTSSVHRVVEENYNGSDPTAIFETDLWDPQLHAAVSGHRVNGSALCPSVSQSPLWTRPRM